MEESEEVPSTVSSYDHMFKVIIIGDPCCGKTSMLLRSTLSQKNEEYNMTVGVDCKARTFAY
jgi:GTPase SAR1 family protein